MDVIILQVRYTSMSLVNSIHTGSRTLLGHFHHLLKGAKPFDHDWTSKQTTPSIARMAELDARQMEFLARLAPKIKEKSTNLLFFVLFLLTGKLSAVVARYYKDA